MSYLANLLFSFSGRISRGSYIFGISLVMIVAIGGGYLLDPDQYNFALDPPPPPTLTHNILLLFSLVPTMAITVKRLADRDWGRWLAGLVFIVALPLYMGLFFMGDAIAAVEYLETLSEEEIDAIFDANAPYVLGGFLYGVAFLVLSTWVLIDNGLLPGTHGPNQYGPDPLNPTICARVSVPPRRSLDAQRPVGFGRRT